MVRSVATSCGLAVALASTGCAQLLGIDETSGGDDSARSVEVVGVYDGASLVMAPVDLSAETASWFEPDASDPSKLDSVVATPATAFSGWTASIAGSAPSIEFTAPDVPTPYTHFVELPDDKVIVSEFFYGHPSPEPAPPDAMFDVTLTVPTAIQASEQFVLYAVGAWTDYTLTAAEAPPGGTTIGPITVPYSSFSPITSAPSVRISAADVVVVLRYIGNAMTGALAIASFDQSDATDPLMGTLTAVDVDQNFTATIDATATSARYNALRPAMSGFSAGWTVSAAPGALATSGAGPQLAAGAIAPTDTSFTAMYGNPFGAQSWPTLVSFSTSETRSFTAGGVAFDLYAGLYTYTDSTAGQTLEVPAGLPELVSIDQMPLSTDGMTVTLPAAAPVEISFVSDQVSNTSYRIFMDEIVVTGTTLTRTPVFVADSVQPDVTIPAAQFLVGHTYVLRAVCVSGGEPNVDLGDLSVHALPISIGYFDSAVFTIGS